MGFGGFQNHSPFCPWPKSPSLSPRPALYLLGRHLPPEPAHPCELSPCPPFQGKSNTALEDFRSSTSPKPTTTPVSSLWALQSPLTGRSLPSSCIPWGIPDPQPHRGNTTGLCSSRWEPAAAPRGCPAGRFTAEVPARIFITTLSCFMARAQQTALPHPHCPLHRPFPISSKIFHHFKGNKVSSEGKRKVVPRATGFEIVRGAFDGLPGQAPGPGSLQITPRGRKHDQPL